MFVYFESWDHNILISTVFRPSDCRLWWERENSEQMILFLNFEQWKWKIYNKKSVKLIHFIWRVFWPGLFKIFWLTVLLLLLLSFFLGKFVQLLKWWWRGGGLHSSTWLQPRWRLIGKLFRIVKERFNHIVFGATFGLNYGESIFIIIVRIIGTLHRKLFQVFENINLGILDDLGWSVFDLDVVA